MMVGRDGGGEGGRAVGGMIGRQGKHSNSSTLGHIFYILHLGDVNPPPSLNKFNRYCLSIDLLMHT